MGRMKYFGYLLSVQTGKINLPSGISYAHLSWWERQEQNSIKDKLDNFYVKDIERYWKFRLKVCVHPAESKPNIK